jgi:hypothetical protein
MSFYDLKLHDDVKHRLDEVDKKIAIIEKSLYELHRAILTVSNQQIETYRSK